MLGFTDFEVVVPSGRDAVILHLSDLMWNRILEYSLTAGYIHRIETSPSLSGFYFLLIFD